MAVRFATNGDALGTTAGAPDDASTTFVAWVYMTAGTATNAALIRIRTSADALVTELGTKVDGVTIRLNSTGNTLNGTYVFTAGVWAKVACTIAGTTGTIYSADGQSNTVTSTTGTLSAGTAARFTLGGRPDSTGLWNGRMAGVKLYNRVLTLDEIRTEWTQILPVNTAGLHAAYPLDSGSASGLLDVSGNGPMLSQGTTLTEDGPPIPRRRVLIRPYLLAPSGADNSASAGAATGTGTAYPATVTVATTAGVATGTGTAFDAAPTSATSGVATAGVATGTGTAYPATITVATTAGSAAGTGSALNATLRVGVTPTAATGTGAAFNAAPTTPTSASATAGSAAGTGAAFNATLRIIDYPVRADTVVDLATRYHAGTPH